MKETRESVQSESRSDCGGPAGREGQGLGTWKPLPASLRNRQSGFEGRGHGLSADTAVATLRDAGIPGAVIRGSGIRGMWVCVTILLGMVLCLALGCASTPPIVDGQGKVVEGSIASLECVTINGRKEWISIRGQKRTAPVLLILAGGPGASELATMRLRLGMLEKHFVVVNWDQPGAGKSFRAIRHRDLTLDIYLDDCLALVDLLRERFGVDKVSILGESWGSFLGAVFASRHPDRVERFFGTGQMVAFLPNDLACYELVLAWARERGDTKKVEKLVRQGPPPYYGPGVMKKTAAFLNDTFSYMSEVRKVRSGGNMFLDVLNREYTLADKVNWFRGLMASLEEFYPKLWDMDLRTMTAGFEMPVFFLVGRHDVNASIPLLLDWFGKIEAPEKEIVWFEHSGHTPWSSESEAFAEALLARSGVVTH